MLCSYWDKKATTKVRAGRQSLNFEQITTIDEHDSLIQTVKCLAKIVRPTIVLTASGMVGSDIQKYGPSGKGYINLDGECYRLGVHAILGYLVYAVQKDLINFIKEM